MADVTTTEPSTSSATTTFTTAPLGADCETAKNMIRHRTYEQYHALANSDNSDSDDDIHADPKEMDGAYRKKQTRCYKIIIFLLIVILIALSIALAVVKVRSRQNPTVAPSSSSSDVLTCTTDNCIEASGDIVAQMNFSAEPCVDFYNYACGSFVKDRFLRPAQTRLSQFTILSDKNTEVVYQELTNDKVTIFGKNSTALVKVKKLHKLCMDVTTLQRDGHRPLLMAIEEFGSWAITNNTFDPATWNFTEQMLGLHRYSLSPIFSISVDADEKNSSVNILNLFQHGLTLSSEKDYNLTEQVNRDKKAALVDYGVEIARLLGANESLARPVMEEIYALEAELAAIYVPSEVIRDPKLSYNKFTLTEAQPMFEPHLDISNFLNAVTNRTNISNDNHLVSSTKDYLVKLGQVLDKYLSNDTLKRVMNNYLTWYMVHRTIDNLGSDFQYAQLILTSVTEGTNSIDERWKICTQKMDNVMGRATGAAFIEGRFGSEDRTAVTDIVKSVRDTLIENFPGYAWMDEETRIAAIGKAKAIKTRIGYPDYITDGTLVDAYYQDLEITDTLYDSLMQYRLWVRKISSAKLDHAPDTTEWKMTASEVNAYYHPVYNTVVLPAGILRKPFYDTNLPLAWNYGGMGSVVGHEISHGFDDQGSQFDADGNLVNWWTNSSYDGFNDAKQCFVDQYSKYSLGGTPLNSKLCLGENIADNGGVSVAYKAYVQKLEDSGEMPKKLPGLELTDVQLFFLSFAQIWCAKSTPEYDQTSLNYNPHSPSQFRVQGTYSNSRAFSDAFHCQEGAPYNPSEKCKVW